ncbi:hypothetical protein Goklo_020637 [Gossypium klotzschianum]|uniref:Uncharacterized protein n=1 Tax=Gossypium klotzschianum TaxID=34286 RepID=A0A7J8USG8_9ROSI|nr:hypothetical protein [Gossypium klotzschianum]
MVRFIFIFDYSEWTIDL